MKDVQKCAQRMAGRMAAERKFRVGQKLSGKRIRRFTDSFGPNVGLVIQAHTYQP